MGSTGLVLSNLARILFRIPLSLWLKTSGGKWALPERAPLLLRHLKSCPLPPIYDCLLWKRLAERPEGASGRALFTMEPRACFPF